MRLNKLGRYDLIRVLGKGAMGLVYEGRDPNLDRRVAIKTIRVENLSDEAATEYEVRFRTEARSAARLQHPNIVSVYDSDRDLDIAYLVMEFIQGEDLKYHLDRGDVYTLAQTLGIMQGLLSALEYAHQQSIVHRDIKPANLLIEASGRVKLADFGVARIQDSGDATRTQGTMVGTLKYMSPEQIEGRPVDARADLFAAGIVLYQLLTGKRPFDAETDFALIQQIVSHEPAAPSHVNPQLPQALDAVMARALAKSRNQRYATAQEFSAALQEASRTADPTVVPPSNAADQRTASTWTATLRAGESLLSTQPGAGLGTNSATYLNTGTNSSGSIVTQELELVYWKDIKDSADIEDIEVFLAKFPAGVYADLARRRLKKIAQSSGEVSDIGLASSTRVMSPLQGQDELDKTVMVSRPRAEMAVPVDIVRIPATVTPVADSMTDEALTVVAQIIAGAAAVPPSPPDIGTVPATPVTAPPETRVLTEKASSLAHPSKTPVAPPRTTATQTEPDTPPPNTPPVVTPPPLKTEQQFEEQAPPDAVLTAKPSRRLVWAAAGVVVLACAGLGVKFLSGKPSASAASDASLAISGAASAPATTPTIAPVAAASAPDMAASAASAAASPTHTVAANAAVPASVASAPSASASAAAAAKTALAQAAAKKATIEKDRLAKLALEKNAAQPSRADNPVAPAPPPPPPEKTVAPAAAQAAVANSPRQACEDRILIGFQICMRDQCAKPAFANHPICLERKAMEQQRRDAQTGK